MTKKIFFDRFWHYWVSYFLKCSLVVVIQLYQIIADFLNWLLPAKNDRLTSFPPKMMGHIKERVTASNSEFITIQMTNK